MKNAKKKWQKKKEKVAEENVLMNKGKKIN